MFDIDDRTQVARYNALAETPHQAASTSPLPETHPIAIAGRTAFFIVLLLLLWTSFTHPPRIFWSYREEHFSLFYLFALTAGLAIKRKRLLTVGYALATSALALELVRAAVIRHAQTSYADGIGDLAGIVTALGPMLVQKIRARFEPAKPATALTIPTQTAPSGAAPRVADKFL